MKDFDEGLGPTCPNLVRLTDFLNDGLPPFEMFAIEVHCKCHNFCQERCDRLNIIQRIANTDPSKLAESKPSLLSRLFPGLGARSDNAKFG